MKLKITVGRLNQVDQFTPIKSSDYSADSIDQAMDAFKTFFSDNPELALPRDVEMILQSGDPMKVNTILSIKYFLKEAGMGLEYYAFNEDEETILDEITRTSGILLLDEAQNFYGFIPRGYFLRFNSESDANPLKVYDWMGSVVDFFPSQSSDPYNATLTQTKELADIMGSVSTPVVSQFMKYLASFKKRAIII
jgi:hypothetical protein